MAASDPSQRLVGGRYQLVGQIGEGGMGSVYRGFDRVIGRQIAIKMLGEGSAKNEETVARFKREAQVVGQLRHRDVVEVFDFGIEDGRPFMVMELLVGKDLATLLDKRGALPVGRAVDIVLGVAAGLSAAHDGGLVHRDIKPANIFLSHEGNEEVPKILDFGISKTSNSRLTQAGSVFGTQHYISPEQARNSSDVDPRSDQYALGVILYQCLTGRLPHDGDNVYAVIKNIVEGRFEPPRSHRPELPLALELIVMKTMATDPAERFPSVHEMGVNLLPFASERGKRQWSDLFSRVPLPPEYSAVVPSRDGSQDHTRRNPQVAPTDVIPPEPPVPRRVAPTEVLPPEQDGPGRAATSPSPPGKPSKRARPVRIREPLPGLSAGRRKDRPRLPPLAVAIGLGALVGGGLLLLRLSFWRDPSNAPKTAVTASTPAPEPTVSPPVPAVPAGPAAIPAPAPATSTPPLPSGDLPSLTAKTAPPKREKSHASKRQRRRYNDDGVPLIMP